MKAFVNLSPSSVRVGRACAWIERGDGRVLMTGLEWGGWTLPGGGVHPSETAAQAAVREAWEEAGARCEVAGDPVTLRGASGVEAECYPLRLLSLEPSPEGRPVAWVNPRSLPWADDVQLRQVLAARGETPPALARPPLVARALAEAEAQGFFRSCSTETGRLLRTLAALRPGGRVLELGGGMGVGAAWLLAGLDAGARLLTVDADPACVEVTATLLANDPRAEARRADWREGLGHGPFDLIFVDCGPAKQAETVEMLVDALRPGGMLVLDDLRPPAFLPERLHGGDPLREAFHAHPRLLCTEVSVSRRECVVLATRTA